MPQKAVRELPEEYGLLKTLDLTKNVKLAIGLNLANLGLFVVFGIVFYWLLSLVRPGEWVGRVFLTTGLFDSNSVFTQFLLIALVYLAMIMLHEAVHGVFFWLFTKEKPEFGFRGFYAYAGAPTWYLPKKPYLVVGLAPLVLISVVGFFVMIFVPPGWVFPIFLFITLNASGSVGDIYAVFWILSKPDQILVQDFGDRMQVYSPGISEEKSETVVD